jgi:hypothetical protein
VIFDFPQLHTHGDSAHGHPQPTLSDESVSMRPLSNLLSECASRLKVAHAGLGKI